MCIDDNRTRGQYFCSTAKSSADPLMPCLRRKTNLATIKITAGVRRAWEVAAEFERRSLANVFEVAILAYVRRHHMTAPTAAAALAARDIAGAGTPEQSRERN